MALERSSRTAAIADRIGEIAALLYFGDRRRHGTLKTPGNALRRMLTRLKVDPAAFGKRWQSLAGGLVLHARRVCKVQPKCRSCPFVSFCETGQRQITQDDRPVVVDIFGGAGGLGSGFRRAGFRIGLAVESDRNAAQTYRLNNPGTPVFEVDAGKISTAWLIEIVGQRSRGTLCRSTLPEFFCRRSTRE